MAATFNKNDSTDTRRVAHLRIFADDGVTPAPRQIDFSSDVFLDEGTGLFVAAGGTIINKRRVLTVATQTVSAVDTVNDRLTIAGNPFQLGDGAVQITSSGAIPGGLAAATNYWVTISGPDGATGLGLSTTLANAYAGIRIDITSAGSGTIQLTATGAQRGLDAEFMYAATQAETNVDASEIVVMVEAAGYTRAITTVSTRNTSKIDQLATDYTTARAAKLDFLDAAISSVASTLASAHGSGSWLTPTTPINANVVQWEGVTPAPLSSSGFIQVLLKAWLTDDSAGTPNPLSSHDVQVTVDAAAVATSVLDSLRSSHIVPGSVGEGIAISASLLQGNFLIDNTDNSNPNGQTGARVRCFLNGSAAQAATVGGTGEGEFATFVVTTEYVGPSKIKSHRAVQQ